MRYERSVVPYTVFCCGHCFLSRADKGLVIRFERAEEQDGLGARRALTLGFLLA